jgi:hypothetical protein
MDRIIASAAAASAAAACGALYADANDAAHVLRAGLGDARHGAIELIDVRGSLPRAAWSRMGPS